MEDNPLFFGVLGKESFQGASRKQTRKDLRSLKKDALAASTSRKERRAIRRNFRKSKNEVFRDGQTWLGSVVQKVGTPIATVLGGGVTGLALDTLLPNVKANTLKNDTKQMNLKGSILGDNKPINWKDIGKSVLDGVLGNKDDKTPTTTTTPQNEGSQSVNQTLGNMWNHIKKNWIWYTGGTVLAVLTWVFWPKKQSKFKLKK